MTPSRDKEASRELVEEAAFYSRAACGHHSLDRDGTFLMINDTELGWLGYSREEVVGKLRFADLCTAESRPVFEENFRKFKAGGKKHNVEYDLVRKDGSVLPVLLDATAAYGQDGEYLRSYATVFDRTGRRQVERQLRATLAEVEDLYENAPCGYHSVDANGLFVRMNRTELRWFGYEREDVIGRLRAVDVLPPGGRLLFERNFPLLKKQGFIENVEMEFCRKDGSTFPVLIQATAVYGPGGEYRMSRSTVIDLTARKEIERSLQERDRLIRRIAELTPDFVYVLDLARRKLLYGNRELAQIVGLPLQSDGTDGEASCPPLLQLENPAAFLALRERYENVSDAQVVESEQRFRAPDGACRWTYGRSVVFERGADGRPTQVLGIAQDITGRKVAEEALRRSEALHRTLVEAVPIGIVQTDPDGRISFASTACCRMLGADSEKVVVGTRIGDWLSPESAPSSWERRSSPRPRGDPYELKLRRLDGTTFWAEVVAEPLSDEGRRFAGEIVAVQDVTERRRTTDRIRSDSERLQLLSRRVVEVQEEERRRLGRELHDEIGQTLTAILYRLEAMGAPGGPDRREILGETIRIADEAIQKVRDLSLTLCPVQLEEADLSVLLRSLVERLAIRRNVEVELVVSPEASGFRPEVRTACLRVVQEALTNVVRHAKAGKLRISIQTDGKFADLSVQDDGRGFDVNDARQRAAAGRSLGLFSMEERVELLGGRLEITSEPGRGTEIKARLPLEEGTMTVPE